MPIRAGTGGAQRSLEWSESKGCPGLLVFCASEVQAGCQIQLWLLLGQCIRGEATAGSLDQRCKTPQVICPFVPLATVEPGCSCRWYRAIQVCRIVEYAYCLHLLPWTVCSGKPVIACAYRSRLIARGITTPSAPAVTHGAQGPVTECCCRLRNHGLRLENPAILAREDSPRREAHQNPRWPLPSPRADHAHGNGKLVPASKSDHH